MKSWHNIGGRVLGVVAALVALGFVSAATFISGSAERELRMAVWRVGVDSVQPLFVTDILIAERQQWFVTTNKGDKSLKYYDPAATFEEPIWAVYFDQTPTGVAMGKDSANLYVTTFDTQGLLEVIRPVSIEGKAMAMTKSIRVGHGPLSPVVHTDPQTGRELVYVVNQFSDDVMEVDPAQGRVLRTVKVLVQPRGAVVSEDGKYLFVTNFKPAGRADEDFVASAVSVIELSSFKKIKDIALANGSNALRGIALSSDGKYVFVSHNLGRFTVPTTQLQQGWMNTSAMSVIDAERLEFLGSLIVDEPERGAAGIWDIKSVGDKIFITHSGTHEVSVVDYPAMIQKLKNYRGAKEELEYDLRFMYGLRQRIKLAGNGPRKMAVDRESGVVYIPTYFSDTLNVLDIKDNGLDAAIPMVRDRQESREQAGERIFNDAMYCFQNWQSCNGCHPGEAREDGMNWDLQNDGIGNSKNCKSLLYSHVTPPSMISGIRAQAEIAVDKGFAHIQFYTMPQEELSMVDDYLKSLEAVPSPLLVDGQLSQKAVLGKRVFERLQCGTCHSGPYYTDMQMHRIGDDIEFPAGWDTPTLREVWRTGPYLFDGRAATMRDVFEQHRHGIDPGQKVSAKEIEQLVEYVNSL